MHHSNLIAVPIELDSSGIICNFFRLRTDFGGGSLAAALDQLPNAEGRGGRVQDKHKHRAASEQQRLAAHA